jgi:hypothetical protein
MIAFIAAAEVFISAQLTACLCACVRASPCMHVWLVITLYYTQETHFSVAYNWCNYLKNIRKNLYNRLRKIYVIFTDFNF